MNPVDVLRLDQAGASLRGIAMADRCRAFGYLRRVGDQGSWEKTYAAAIDLARHEQIYPKQAA